MGTLFFDDRFGNARIVAQNISEKDIFLAIKNYISYLNPKYKIYYIRSWDRDGEIIYDVGSHSEFFRYKEEQY